MLAVAMTACGSSNGGTSSSPSSTGSQAKTPTGTPWVIGQIGSFTGPAASTLGEAAPGFEAWVKYTNDHGGIDNHPIKLVQLDDGADPAKSTAAVKQLVEQDKVIAIVDYSLVDSAWADYVKDKGVPVIGAILFNKTFGTNPDFFPVGATFEGIQYGMLAEAAKAGAKTFGFFSVTNTAAAQETIAWYRENTTKLNLGFTSPPLIVTMDYVSPNYTAQCLEAKSQNIAAVYVGAPTTQTLKVYDDCKKQNYNFTHVGNLYQVNDTWLTTPSADGAIIASAVVPIASTLPANQEFVKAMATYAPGVKYGGTAQMNWVAGQLFAAAAKAAKLGDSPTAAGVLDGLYALKGETLGGLAPPLTFVKGKPTTIPCWFTYKVSNGSFVVPPGGDKAQCQPS